MAVRHTIEATDLGDAIKAIKAGKAAELRRALGKAPALQSLQVRGTEWSGDYFLHRALFARFREGELTPERTIVLAELLLDSGASRKSLCSAFDESVVQFHLPSVGGCTDAQILGLVKWLRRNSKQGKMVARIWASGTLGGLLKRAVWSKWGIDGFEKDPDDDLDELPLTPEFIAELIELGAGPDSFPPPWHKEQNPASYYALELGDPRLCQALFAKSDGESDASPKPGKSSQRRSAYKSASKAERDQIISALRSADLDPRTWEPAKSAAGGRRLERLIGLMGARYLPKLERINLAEVDRSRSMLGGVPFTSRSFSWPMMSGTPLAPLLQLDLAVISNVAGCDLGNGLLQLWVPARQGLIEYHTRPILFRVIPRAAVQRTKKLSSPPRLFQECGKSPEYSWNLSLLGAPQYISDWIKAGYALPELTVASTLYLDEPEDDIDWERLAGASTRSRHPELGAALFDCPVFTETFFDLPKSWRPLITVYGPLNGYERKGSFPIRDLVEVYFRHDKSGRVSFTAAWLRH